MLNVQVNSLMELTDAQWELLRALVEPAACKRRGRPWRDTRQVLEGVLWILRTGAQWARLPRDKFPPHQTCHRRFQQWVREGTLVKVLWRLAEDLRARGQTDLAETFIDVSFSGMRRRNGAARSARRGKGTKVMAISGACPQDQPRQGPKAAQAQDRV